MSANKSIVIDTGNVFSLDIIQRKALLNPNEEVVEGIENILKAYCESKYEAAEVKVLNRDVTYVASGQDLSANADRGELKLTVKLFLYPQEYPTEEESLKGVIDEAVASIVQLLNVNNVDSLVLSIQESQTDKIMPYLKTFWSACEAHTDKGKLQSLGTSDLSRDQLGELFQASTIKPVSSQINLDACCDIPEELSAFTKANSIKLLTHNDPLSDFVPVERIRSMLDSIKGAEDSSTLFSQIIPNGTANLNRKWIARYTLVLASQGVLLSKGYLVALTSTSASQ